MAAAEKVAHGKYLCLLRKQHGIILEPARLLIGTGQLLQTVKHLT